MKISVHCEECQNDQEITDMVPVGVRTINRETQTQSQTYKCSKCKKEVTILIEKEELK